LPNKLHFAALEIKRQHLKSFTPKSILLLLLFAAFTAKAQISIPVFPSNATAEDSFRFHSMLAALADYDVAILSSKNDGSVYISYSGWFGLGYKKGKWEKFILQESEEKVISKMELYKYDKNDPYYDDSVPDSVSMEYFLCDQQHVDSAWDALVANRFFFINNDSLKLKYKGADTWFYGIIVKSKYCFSLFECVLPKYLDKREPCHTDRERFYRCLDIFWRGWDKNFANSMQYELKEK
jgi:hypothetical protein